MSDRSHGLKIVARKPRNIDCEYVLIERGPYSAHRYVVGTANARSLASGEWFWGHYFQTQAEALSYFNAAN